jgi:hypothetical protein
VDRGRVAVLALVQGFPQTGSFDVFENKMVYTAQATGLNRWFCVEKEWLKLRLNLFGEEEEEEMRTGWNRKLAVSM